jgi:hypothetical protein
MVSGIQLLGVFFALVQCYFTFLNFKRREFTMRECFAWLAVWIIFGLVTLFPTEFQVLAGNFGAFRTLDLFTIGGFMVVLSISFYTYVHLDRLRKKLERVIRELALHDLED